jgi:hypothetical protein
MRPQAGRTKLGVLAVAFDAAGREILSALADRPGTPQVDIECVHAVEEDDGSIAWFRRSPGGAWRKPDWSASAARLETGLEAAIRGMLDVERWQTPGGGLDLLNLIVVSPGSEPGSGVLPKETLAVLKQLRRRFKKIGRLLLLADGTYETVGEAAPAGQIRSLPYPDGSDGGLFDVILLLDRINTEGMAVNDVEEARAQAAGILHHLTTGELAPVLFARIQAEQARLNSAGRYVSLGFTEWRLTSELGIQATSSALYRGIAERLSNILSTPLDEAAAKPVDPWLEETSPEILAEPPQSGPIPAEDLLSKIATFEEKSHESLHIALRGTGWQLDHLEPFLKRRISALKQLEAQVALKLAHFMDDSFARWYAESRTSRVRQPEPQVFFEEETDTTRAGAFVATLLICLVAAGFAIFSEDKVPASIIAGAAGIGAIVIALKGFKRKISRTVQAAPPSRSLMPELTFRRGQSWLARELVRRSEAALESWRRTRKALQDELAVPAESIPILFPFSPEVTRALLAERSVSAAESLHRFWESEATALKAAVGRSGASFSDLLRKFARECCRPLANLGWSDIFRVIGGGSGLEASSWRDALEKARSSALPWMPVAGLSLQTFLALPRGLSSDLRNALSHQFPDQKVIEEIDGDAILVFQVTQGYRVVDKPSSS